MSLLRNLTILAFWVLLCMSPGYAHAQNEDIKLLRHINLERDRSLDGLMKGITNSTYPVSAALPAAQLIDGFVRHDKKIIRNGLFTVAGDVATGIITYGIKYAVNRKPPYETYPDIQAYEHTISPCFPSGHSTFAFYTAGTLTLYYRKWYVAAPAYLWAAAVGYSRLDLGDHYPSDVLAGAALGTATAWLTYKANNWLGRKHK